MKIRKNQIFDFLDYLQFSKLCSNNTIRAYRSDLINWFGFLKNSKNNLNELEIIKLTYDWLIKDQNSKLLKKTSISRKISAIKSFLDYLYKIDVIENKLSLTLKNPKKDRMLPKYLNSSDIADVISKNFTSNNFYNIRNSLIILLLFNTGIRISELENIKIEDINFDRNEIRIIGKGNKERIVFFTNFTKDFLKKYINERQKLKTNCQYLLLSRLKNKISERMIRYIVSNIWETQTGKRITPHQLRHSLATFLLNQGVELKYIQEILGHENINTTNIYAKLTEKTIKTEYYKSLDKLEK
ncbi:tyrosine recombinase XerC subunit [Thermodesulfobium acidiphilum]|uniref:Tyrosine recombinase XerC subunit n=1 Tax=Thermodesulfobium acidiphilum TaxID=1794699 RepID=A0A2R4W0K2_THEAF|nr:tyrosine-type recombinase/integrase [Thermodesulfobium acidiphilum]AWB10244.1 tyrosine recombinase XerC subunit [Thermodesulfobium acidiphilum]